MILRTSRGRITQNGSVFAIACSEKKSAFSLSTHLTVEKALGMNRVDRVSVDVESLRQEDTITPHRLWSMRNERAMSMRIVKTDTDSFSSDSSLLDGNQGKILATSIPAVVDR